MPGELAPYVAILLYETSSDAVDYEPLYREDFVLIHAESLEQARDKAIARARAEEGSYRNGDGELITWTLKHLVDVNSALQDDLSGDADLYARHFRNFPAYRDFEPLL